MTNIFKHSKSMLTDITNSVSYPIFQICPSLTSTQAWNRSCAFVS